MTRVRPKKFLGQHFLKDHNIAKKIAGSLTGHGAYNTILEIGPGTGVLTQFLINDKKKLYVCEIDRESVAYLKDHFLPDELTILEGDFLKMDLSETFTGDYAVIGNFPYNISSQIFFKVLACHPQIPEVVCMIQKEVAERICASHGSKKYGILSVLLGAYYDIKILFNVSPGVFNPPPKVESAVIRMQLKTGFILPCDEKLLTKVVKQGFQNRRKTLRNALKPINLPESLLNDPILDKRAEQLSVDAFFSLTNKIEEHWNH